MNRDILMLSIGAVLGAGVSFLITQKLLEGKYVALAQEESAFNERFNQRMERKHSDESENSAKGFIDGLNISQRDLISHSSLQGTRTNEYNRTKQNYNLVGKRTAGEEITEEYDEEDEYDDEVNPETDDESVDSEYPYVITEESFSEEFLNHDKLSITYYMEDDVLADENEGIVDDVDMLVGYDNLNEMNAGLMHPQTIYVRNERISIDYEISINFNSYQETVLGIKLDPKQRQENLSRRRNRERNLQDE